MSAKTHAASPGQSLIGVQRQDLLLTQRMIMSAQMQQAIRLLQMPLQDLEVFIEEQIADNPILEMGEFEQDDEENLANDLIDFSGEITNETVENEESELIISDQDLSILSRLDEDRQDDFFQNENNGGLRSSTSEQKEFKTYQEQSIYFEPTLQDQLINQAAQTFETPSDLEIAKLLIGYIDRFGFLKTDLSEIAELHSLNLTTLNAVLKTIQTFDPYGVGASSIQESLLIQLTLLNKSSSIAYKIVQNHYDALLHNQLPLIQKSLKCRMEDIQHAITYDIVKLSIHPGTEFCNDKAQAIIPDATLRIDKEDLVVDVERDYLPTLRLNRRYLNMLSDSEVPSETKHYIKQHLFSAKWLVKNLSQRYSTLERIAMSLAVRQRAFFMNPDGQLVPLTMKIIAEELDVHESTIARTVANKYISTPRGLFALRTFFTSKLTSQEGADLSSQTIRDAITDLISHENKQTPLSDEKIVQLLKEKGMICARRTVSKYRKQLQIGNRQQRKQFFDTTKTQ